MTEASVEIIGRDGDAISLNETMLRAMPSFVKAEDGGFEGVVLSAAIPDDFREGGQTLRLTGADSYSADLSVTDILDKGILAYSKDRRPLERFRIHIPQASACGSDVPDQCARVKDVVRIEIV